MLSIILGILKIIGIVVLVILGILLVLLLLVLFVPLRYEARVKGQYGQTGDGESEDAAGDFLIRARISWLLRSITVRAKADKSGLTAKVKLLGIPIIRIGEEKKKKKRKKRKQVSEEPVSEEPVSEEPALEEPVLEEPAFKEPVLEEPVMEKTVSEVPIHVEFPEDAVEKTAKEASEKIQEERKENFFVRFLDKVKAVWRKLIEKIKTFFEKLKSVFENIREKAERLKFMAGEIKGFLSDEKNKEAIRFLASEGKKLLKHVLPGKISGNISFGLEDPASTGKALMALGFVYPVLQDKVQVVPLFENRNYIEGDICLKGRIRAFSLLIIGLKVWFDKRVKGFIRRGKKLKESLG